MCGADDEDDDTLGMGWESTDQSKWQRLAVVVDSGAVANVLPAGVCSHVKNSPQLAGLKQAWGFVEPVESESGTTVRGSSGFACHTGMWREAHGRWADVKRPLMSVAEMAAPGNHVHLDSKDPRIIRPQGDVIPLRKAGNVFVPEIGDNEDAMSRKPVFSGRHESTRLRRRWVGRP